MPYVALALALFGALWWMPVRADGRADINRVPTLHLNCFLWKFRLAYDAVVERRSGGLALSIRKRGSKSEPDQGFDATVNDIRTAFFFLRDHPRCVKSLRHCLGLRGLHISMRVGVGDAAQTALVYGACCTALQFVARRVFVASGVRPTVSVRQDRDAAFLCSVRCIIEFHVGNIMGAAIWLALESVAGKVGSVWNGIQSKA